MSEINDFCIKKCPLGVEKSDELLNKNGSVFDAVIDMSFFVEECKKTCPYKDKFTG